MAKVKKAKTKSSNKAPSFEEALERLETIVNELEEGRLGLTDSLEKYQQGVKCLKQCHQSLQAAERQIELLAGVDAEGNPVTEPFDEAEMSLDEKAQARGRRRSRKAASPDPQSGPENDVDEPRGLF